MASSQNSGGSTGGPQTASGPAQRVIRNPEFDARLTPSGAVDQNGKFMAARSKLYRGRLESAPEHGYVNDKVIYQLQYLWNPTAVNHTSALDAQYLPQNVVNSSEFARGDASPFMQISQNISFSLLFDRTYETWVANEDNYLATWGVLADIKVLYAMLGMFSSVETTLGDDKKSAITKINGGIVEPDLIMQMTPTSAHQFQPVWAIFGPLLKYYGSITQFSVDYTHFTQAMVPNRCVVQINMQLIPKSHTPSRTAQQRASAAQRTVTRGTTGRPVNRGLYGP